MIADENINVEDLDQEIHVSDYTTVQVEFNHPKFLTKYTYACQRGLAATLAPGSLVVVEARNFYGVARVTDVHPEPQIPEQFTIDTLKWVIQRVEVPHERA